MPLRLDDTPQSASYDEFAARFPNMLVNGAGGKFAVPGDYLVRSFQSFQFDGGMWGILRVTP